MATLNNKNESASFTTQIRDAVFEHLLADCLPQRFGKVLQGVLIGTGSAKESTAGHTQHLAYCSVTCQKYCVLSLLATRCHIGIGSVVSKRVATIRFPTGELWLSFEAQIVGAAFLLLFPLRI